MKQWKIQASEVSKRTSNPIRKIVDKMNKKDCDQSKELIQLDIGDPTVFGNLNVPDTAVQAITEALAKKTYNGYGHSAGIPEARKAVAKKYDYGYNLTENDVFLASACSGALEIVFAAMANEGENILIPSPGFSLYQTLCDSKGIEAKCYKLLPDKDWEADLAHMKSLINNKTRAILINNPSNPCGCVYSKQHLLDILDVAREFCVPIIADEIYANMTFNGYQFHAMASLCNDVPIVCVGGLAKQYMVPGWRVGWIVLYDKQNLLTELRDGILRLTTLILGPSTLVQAAVPKMLLETPESYYKSVLATLEENAMFCVEKAQHLPGLKIIQPKGAMYVMIGIDVSKFKPESGIVDDISFAQKLLKEESVSVLPGQCFRIQNFVRVVFCAPKPKLDVAFSRLQSFCQRYITQE